MERKHSKSTKSGYASKPRVRRKTDIIPLQAEGIRYIWAAYRQGGLKDLDPIFDTKMSPDEFSQIFAEYVDTVYNGPSWLLMGETRGRVTALGFATSSTMGPKVLVITGLEWFPWASPRSILEGTVNFFNFLRKEHTALFFVNRKHERFYRDHIVPRKVIRAIGPVHGIFPDCPAIFFQTRRWGDW